MERIPARVDNILKFPNGAELRTKRKDLRKRTIIPGDTAKHEAWHVVGAKGDIVVATNKPKGDALGYTIPYKMTGAAAAAAFVNGCSGAGHDMMLADLYLGGAGKAISEARAATAGREQEMIEIATDIEEKGSIGRTDAIACMERVDNRRQGIFEVEVVITTPDGKNQTITTNSYRGEIKLSNHQLKVIEDDPDTQQLPKAA